MNTKRMSSRQKAALLGVSVAHYCAVVAHRAKPSYKTARAIARIEKVHFLHLLDPEQYDERGNRGSPGAASQN